ncbi:hypothetical protein IFM46972_04213 [Aspergillus udagawae]|uniref:Uncharacterized protein n=1 Tax=Aspergillus udagawae TaxID=91492 RepID=A0A8H3NQS6_9EURO|nr:hypothetical protein IFM46972_04213 [Aspergillus udagawae]
MLKRAPSGTSIQAWIPHSASVLSILLVFCAILRSVFGKLEISIVLKSKILGTQNNQSHS